MGRHRTRPIKEKQSIPHYCSWCNGYFETNTKYGFRYCSPECRIKAKNERLNNAKAELARLRQVQNKKCFLEFLKTHEKFIWRITTEAWERYDKRGYQVRFEYAWVCMREEEHGYHLSNAWKIPCKQYLKDHEPGSLKYFKDVN